MVTLIENAIFYRKLPGGTLRAYIEDSEIEDLVQAIGLSQPEIFVKKHIAWAWQQTIITHFFSVKHEKCEVYGSAWGLASEESTYTFLCLMEEYFKKYSHLHKSNLNNTYIKVSTGAPTDVAQKTLSIVNTILEAFQERAQDFLSSTKKRAITWKGFMLHEENYYYFQNIFSEACTILINNLLENSYYKLSNFNTVFTGREYPRTDSKTYKEQALLPFTGFIKTLIVFAYTYNNEKWIVPQPKNHKASEETVTFFASEVYPLGLETDLKELLQVIEKTLCNKKDQVRPVGNQSTTSFINMNMNTIQDIETSPVENTSKVITKDPEITLVKPIIEMPSEAPIQQVSPTVKEHTFSFNLLGHKLTIRNPFKIETIEYPTPAVTVQDFNDFTEY